MKKTILLTMIASVIICNPMSAITKEELKAKIDAKEQEIDQAYKDKIKNDSEVLDLEATDMYHIVGFNLNSSGTSDEPRKKHRRVMILNRDGSSRIDQDSERTFLGWGPNPSFRQTGVATFGCHEYGRTVLVEMGRCAEGDRQWDAEVFERGFMVFTDEGEAFYPLRGVDFRNLQVVDGAVWGWRLTPGGIILSRYPTPH